MPRLPIKVRAGFNGADMSYYQQGLEVVLTEELHGLRADDELELLRELLQKQCTDLSHRVPHGAQLMMRPVRSSMVVDIAAAPVDKLEEVAQWLLDGLRDALHDLRYGVVRRRLSDMDD